jgi:hypothetical protein
MTKKEQLEQDARIALLAHYSSKSTNQTIIILTIALVSLSFIGVTSSDNPVRDYLLISGFCIFLYFGLRAIGRLIIWGQLGTAIIHVGMIAEKEVKRELQSLNKQLKLGKYAEANSPESLVELSSTNLGRLSSACEVYFHAQRNAKSKSARAVAEFSFVTQSKWWGLVVFGIGLLLTGIRLLWP